MKIAILAAIWKMIILGRTCGFDLLTIAKNCDLPGLKGVSYTKKMRPIGSILVEFQNDSVMAGGIFFLLKQLHLQ